MGNLIIGKIDLNNSRQVRQIIKTIKKLVKNSHNYYQLNCEPPYYFKLQNGEDKLKELKEKSGWYIILNRNKPLYIGQTDDFYKRLNTENGTLDNFNNPKRKSDPERNFIKKFSELKIFDRVSNKRPKK